MHDAHVNGLTPRPDKPASMGTIKTYTDTQLRCTPDSPYISPGSKARRQSKGLKSCPREYVNDGEEVHW